MESEEVETPHHEEDAARLEELLQVTIAPPGYHRMPRLPKAAGRVLTPPIAVDVVVSGGALRGYFMLGARHAIESRADLAVQRYSGTSAGAWTAMFMATDLSSADWLRTYTLTAAVARKAATRGKAAPALMEAVRSPNPNPHPNPTLTLTLTLTLPLASTARTCGHGCRRCCLRTRTRGAPAASSSRSRRSTSAGCRSSPSRSSTPTRNSSRRAPPRAAYRW